MNRYYFITLMVWRRNPLGSKAGLQFSVEKFDEILHKHNIYNLSKEDRIFVTAIAEDLISRLYEASGNNANGKRIYIEDLDQVIKTYKSDIFAEVRDKLNGSTDTFISMDSWSYRKLKQVHPELSRTKLIAFYMDYLIDSYCEKLAKLDLKNLTNSVNNIFGDDNVLCQNILNAGKSAVELYKKYN